MERVWIVLGRLVKTDGSKSEWHIVTPVPLPDEYEAQDRMAMLADEFEHHQFTKVQVPK